MYNIIENQQIPAHIKKSISCLLNIASSPTENIKVINGNNCFSSSWKSNDFKGKDLPADETKQSPLR
jgi:hypothetical protein